MNKDIHNIFESYININEIAFVHSQYDEPEPGKGEDILLHILQQLQKSSGPLYGVPDDKFRSLVDEYAQHSHENPLLEQINSMYVEANLLLLDLKRSNKHVYILLNLEKEYIYPNVFVGDHQAFKDAIDFAGHEFNKITGNLEDPDPLEHPRM